MFALHTIGLILAPGTIGNTCEKILEYVDQVYPVESEEKALPQCLTTLQQNAGSMGMGYSKALREAVADGMNLICILGEADGFPENSLEEMLNRVVWNRTAYIHLERTPASDRDADIQPFIVSDGDAYPHFTPAELSRGLTVLTAHMAGRLAEILSIESRRTLVAIQGFDADVSRMLFLLMKYGDDVLIVFDEGCRMDEEIEERMGATCITLTPGSSFATTATEYATARHYDMLILLSNGPSRRVPVRHDLINSLVDEEVTTNDCSIK